MDGNLHRQHGGMGAPAKKMTKPSLPDARNFSHSNRCIPVADPCGKESEAAQSEKNKQDYISQVGIHSGLEHSGAAGFLSAMSIAYKPPTYTKSAIRKLVRNPNRMARITLVIEPTTVM